MDFNEKLQGLRKQKGMTQEELANALYVSRTAISKWESGRGYPSIDSLKSISDFFGVTLDDLLSVEKAISIAEQDTRKKEHRFRNTVFGLLDISVLLFLFLPLFGQKNEETVRAVSLLSLSGIAPYIKAVYYLTASAISLCGIIAVLFQCFSESITKLTMISLVLSLIGIFIFIITSQPYAATLLLVFTVIKASLLIKKP